MNSTSFRIIIKMLALQASFFMITFVKLQMIVVLLLILSIPLFLSGLFVQVDLFALLVKISGVGSGLSYDTDLITEALTKTYLYASLIVTMLLIAFRKVFGRVNKFVHVEMRVMRKAAYLFLLVAYLPLIVHFFYKGSFGGVVELAIWYVLFMLCNLFAVTLLFACIAVTGWMEETAKSGFSRNDS